jgi:integrase
MSEQLVTGYANGDLRRNATGDWRRRVAALIAENCTVKARDATRSTSNRTRQRAHENVMRVFEWLRTDLGFKGLANPMSLDGRHFEALASHISEKKESGEFGAAHAAGFATYCRHIARWIGKPELVTVFDGKLGRNVCKRQLVALQDKSWEAFGIDPDQKILEVATYRRWVGMVLLAQNAFGLRRNEALQLQPLRDIIPSALAGRKEFDWSLVHVHVEYGAKGGRPRVIPVKDSYGLRVARLLRDEIEWLADRFYLPPPWFTLRQNYDTYRRVLDRFGLTKLELGVTGHGLRAGYACKKLEAAGITPTVRGGDGQHPDPLHQQATYKEVTEAMGHGRVSVVGAYAGAVTPRAAARQQKAMAVKAARMAEIAALGSVDHASQAPNPMFTKGAAS